jgi:hypothetical protein
MNYGTKQGDFLGWEKLTFGHNKMKYGTEHVDFLGLDKLNYGHNKMNFGLNKVTFWDKKFGIKSYQDKFRD